MPGTARVGISGWRYAGWRGKFYPEGLPQKRELEYAAGRFNSIELNGSFYSMQTPSSFARWRDAAPEDFVFAVKGPRYITHMLRLKNVESALGNFFASGLFELQDKQGPFLWQFPGRFRFDAERLSNFFGLLPRTGEDAMHVARQHDHRLKALPSLHANPRQRFRHAIEVRHESFMCPEFVALLRRHDVALVVADTAGRWPHLEDVTADFVYIRLHGDKKIYESGYTHAVLDRWAAKIRAWLDGEQPEEAATVSEKRPRHRKSRDVYVYFDNDMKVYAPRDARRLARKLAAT